MWRGGGRCPPSLGFFSLCHTRRGGGRGGAFTTVAAHTACYHPAGRLNFIRPLNGGQPAAKSEWGRGASVGQLVTLSCPPPRPAWHARVAGAEGGGRVLPPVPVSSGREHRSAGTTESLHSWCNPPVQESSTPPHGTIRAAVALHFLLCASNLRLEANPMDRLQQIEAHR